MQRRARRCAQCEAEKGRASQKQRSEFLAARYTRPPPGRQKSERKFCLFGGVFLSGVPRHMAGWPFLRGLPLLRPFSMAFVLLSRCVVAFPGRFCPLMEASPWLAACRFVPVLRCLPAVCLPCAQFRLVSAVCLSVLRCLHARFPLIFYLLPFPVWLLPRKLLFICRSGRDRPLLSSEKKVDKDSRGALPLRTPFLRPAANHSLFRAAGRLSGPSAANRRLTGKRLKSPGAELSFSSVSVRRGTPAPCG